MAHVHLIASPDDYLLNEEIKQILPRVCSELGGVEPEYMPDDTSPELLAVELCSPSLFAPQRVLVISEARQWVDVPSPNKQYRPPPGTGPAEIDASAVTHVLDEGLSDDIALILRVQCQAKPKGDLVAAIEKSGHLHWQPVPPPPKPWEDAVVSKEQVAVLRAVIAREAPSVGFAPAAERLLFERLGFAPRLLASEVGKLAAAASGDEVDVDLVRRLSFPREGSLEEAFDALLDRRVAPVLEILSAAEGGLPVRDLQGRLMTEKAVYFALAGQATKVFQQLLYLRLLGEREGFLAEMAPDRTAAGAWYPKRFKDGIGPRLQEALKTDAPSPLVPPGGRSPTVFALGKLFRAGGRYTTDELRASLVDLGALEADLRGDAKLEALSVWFSGVLS